MVRHSALMENLKGQTSVEGRVALKVESILRSEDVKLRLESISSGGVVRCPKRIISRLPFRPRMKGISSLQTDFLSSPKSFICIGADCQWCQYGIRPREEMHYSRERMKLLKDIALTLRQSNATHSPFHTHLIDGYSFRPYASPG